MVNVKNAEIDIIHFKMESARKKYSCAWNMIKNKEDVSNV